MRISVSIRDIQKSREAIAAAEHPVPLGYICPIAQAVTRLTDGALVTVADGFLFINEHQYELPPVAVQFHQDFDAGHDVLGVTFEIGDFCDAT